MLKWEKEFRGDDVDWVGCDGHQVPRWLAYDKGEYAKLHDYQAGFTMNESVNSLFDAMLLAECLAAGRVLTGDELEAARAHVERVLRGHEKTTEVER
jgi:hypothetical protein